MKMDEYLKKNGLMISCILLSFSVSFSYYIIINWALNVGKLQPHTTTLGYIICAIILGFTTIWVIYKSIEWAYKRKKK